VAALEKFLYYENPSNYNINPVVSALAWGE
jgi:hypothetical protein